MQIYARKYLSRMTVDLLFFITIKIVIFLNYYNLDFKKNLW